MEYARAANDWYTELPEHDEELMKCDLCEVDLCVGAEYVNFPSATACKHCVDNFSTDELFHYAEITLEEVMYNEL